MNCIHCRASADPEFKDDLTTEQCKRIIKSIADYNRSVLIFTGGEPLERDDIFELIDYAVSVGLPVSVATCGYNFNQDIAQKLVQAQVISLSFSLDSANAVMHDNFRQTPGAFEKTLAAADIARQAGLKFQINTTVTKLNFKNLTEIAELSEKLGAYCFNPFMLVPAGRGVELADIALTGKEYEQTLKTVAKLKAESDIDVRFTCAPRFAVVFHSLYPDSKKKTFGCLAAGDFVFISYEGDVQTCGFLKISAGNILKAGDFGSIWEKSDFLNSIRRKNFVGKCGECIYIETCGGCRARAFAQTGDYLASDPICSYTGPVSTLIAAHIETGQLAAVTDAVNSLPNVSHNYLRDHYYNLWFTLKAKNSDGINKIIKEFSGKFKTEFFSFPATRRYKLDSSAVRRHNPPDIINTLFCYEAQGNVLQSSAEFLSSLDQVSHCFQRKTQPHWPYNIYAMIHSQSSEQLAEIVNDFVERFGIEKFETLGTVKSLKTKHL
ncbi:MAG: radical SAM protein [Sedimentisphaerales bacterium]|nr:radical SAM protein [Sedimentisphaerales bacterium]